MVVLALGEEAAPKAPRKARPSSRGSRTSEARRQSGTRKAGEETRPGTPKRTPRHSTAGTPRKEKENKENKENKEDKEKERREKKDAEKSEKERKDRSKSRKKKEEDKDATRGPLLLRGDGSDSAQDVRGALFELSAAFQRGDKAAAAQAISQLLANPKGLQSLTSLPGFDEASAKYLQTALSAMVPGGDAEMDLEMSEGFAERIAFPEESVRQKVAKDWRQIKERSANLQRSASSSETDPQKKQNGFWKNPKGKKPSEEKDTPKSGTAETKETGKDFNQLVLMNAGIIGANMSFVGPLLRSFDRLLAAAVNQNRGDLELACDLCALRIFREAQGERALKEFKTSMLASARALLPDCWGPSHENAWIAVWDCVCEQLEKALPLPAKYALPAQRFLAGLSKEQRQAVGIRSFDRLFKDHPQVSQHFKQSNMRLAFIVGKALDFAVQLFDAPAKVEDEMTALGLKHIMFQANAQHCGPWVSSVAAEIQRISSQEEAEACNYALCVIGGVLGYALETGTTPVLQAVVKDDAKALRKALQATPRAQRFEAVLGQAA